jgi:serine/threonine protein phosphatase PrpC
MANTKSLYNFSFGNATHVGQVRQANEDYFGNFETKNGYVFIVCDGMGGHVGGAKASQIAVGIIRDCLQQLDYKTPFEALSQSIIAANDAILAYADENTELIGMGTTCVALLVVGSDVYYAHAGDSRIYLFSNKKLMRITKDHSFVQNMMDLGGLTEEEAEKHPRKNEITNALGLKNMKPPTVCKTQIQAAKGDKFLLCTDGLTGMVSDGEMENVLKNSMELQGKANLLIDLANKAGGTDNITVQIVEMTHSAYSKTVANIQIDSQSNKNWKINKKALLVIGLILLSLGGSAFYFRDMFLPKEKMPSEKSIKIDTTHNNRKRSNDIDTMLQKSIDSLKSDEKKSIKADKNKVKPLVLDKSKKSSKDTVKIVDKKKVESDANSPKTTKPTETKSTSTPEVDSKKEAEKTTKTTEN